MTVLLAAVGLGVAILGVAALAVLLAAVGVGIVFLGAYVMLILPDTVGGTARLPGGFEFSSPRAGLPLIGLGVAAIIIAATGVPEQTTQPSTTSTSEAPLFTDDFSTPSERRWKVDADTEDTGGTDIDGTYRMVAKRETGRSGVVASARRPPTVDDVRITADAHRVAGTASSGYGYGLFCRSDGSGNLYAFTIWAQHSVITKRSIDGRSLDLGTSAKVTAAPQGDASKELEVVCRTIDGGSIVELQFWVNGEPILNEKDRQDPYTSGTFGMHAVLGGSGNTGDTLEVEFDNFEATEELE